MKLRGARVLVPTRTGAHTCTRTHTHTHTRLSLLCLRSLDAKKLRSMPSWRSPGVAAAGDAA